MAVIDYDNDGFEDLFITGGQSNVAFIKRHVHLEASRKKGNYRVVKDSCCCKPMSI